MIKCDYHIHTNYSHGECSVEEIIRAAIGMGMDTIGFSGHGYTEFDQSYCMSVENTKKYIAEITEAKKKYAHQINILCGIEQDFYGGKPIAEFDYVIGSVHYVEKDGIYHSVDHTKEIMLDAVNSHFDGDIYSFCEAYYDCVAHVVEATDANIIGHFDLVTKFNEDGALFDAAHPRYAAAWQKAADKLLSAGKLFEINTGAISRGYKTSPYPAFEIVEYLSKGGAKFILSSDSHNAQALCFEFEKWQKELSKIGAEFVNKL